MHYQAFWFLFSTSAHHVESLISFHWCHLVSYLPWHYNLLIIAFHTLSLKVSHLLWLLLLCFYVHFLHLFCMIINRFWIYRAYTIKKRFFYIGNVFLEFVYIIFLFLIISLLENQCVCFLIINSFPNTKLFSLNYQL